MGSAWDSYYDRLDAEADARIERRAKETGMTPEQVVKLDANEVLYRTGHAVHARRMQEDKAEQFYMANRHRAKLPNLPFVIDLRETVLDAEWDET
jgi:hypothetical protein